MEVFAVPTPTYSGNCKANLESFPVERARHAIGNCLAGASAAACALGEQSSPRSCLGEPGIKGPELGSLNSGGGADDRIR